MTAPWWLPPLQKLVGEYLRLGWSDKDQRASVIGMVIGGLSLLWSIVLGVAQMRQASRLAGTTSDPLDPRQDAGRRLRAHLGPTQGLPRMRSVSPRQARVHAAIEAPPQPGGPVRRVLWAPWRTSEPALDPNLPLFIERDLWPDVLRWVRQARQEGGFLLLVGTSSVGKTRLLFEAARHELGDYRAVIPDLGDGGLVNALAADGPREPLIVWLDELQRFLPGPYFTTDQATGHTPLTATAVRHLLDGDTPVVVLGTLWPDYAYQLRATTTDPDTQTTRRRYPQAVDILDLVTRHLTVSSFSDTEREAAARLAARDPRLATAVAHRDYNVTETLAGVPAILRRYREALPEHQAVIHAAVDARRMGIQSVLTIDLLRAAARGYLTAVHTDDAWFGQALPALTRSDRRDDAATAPLVTVADHERRTVVGYTVADYLLQDLLRLRRSELLPEATWLALAHHVHDPDDLQRLISNATRRMQYALAIRIGRIHGDTGDRAAAMRLADLLVEQGKLDQAAALLSIRADNDIFAAMHLADLLVEQGKLDQAAALMSIRADNDMFAAMHLADLLVRQGKLDELRARADNGDTHAAARLTNLLAEQGKLDELRTRADNGDTHAAIQLAEVLSEQDKLDELRTRADNGDTHAAIQLAEVLSEQDKLDELRTRADNGDTHAAIQLAEVLSEQDKLDELRTRADNGDTHAAIRLARILSEQGELDQAEALLCVHADNGDRHAAIQLAIVLGERGKLDQAEKRLRLHTDNDLFAAMQLANLLAEQGKLGELRARADNGDARAAWRLAKILAEQGKLDQAEALLRVYADNHNDGFAAMQLAELLAEQDKLDELRARADNGDARAASRLARILARQGVVDKLWQEIHAGTASPEVLVAMLPDEDWGPDVDTQQLLRWGLNADGSIAQPW
ncbi:MULTISPECIES: hypothetical protein [Amycolatopsis]|uniref:hypothetical protein n=1 Tax=Amycolatopsis TaxID=1813 RepID=UPI00174E6449|nr:hypothetical protein [Amycolatopsis bullii]